MKIDTFEGALVKAFSDRFPRFAAVHQRAQVPVFVSSQCSRSSQKLGSWAAGCLA